MMDARRHCVDMSRGAGHRLGDHVAARIENPGREIAGFADDSRETGPHQRGRLLVDDRDQPVPNDFKFDGIEGHACLTSR
jgi:hypothetical protein